MCVSCRIPTGFKQVAYKQGTLERTVGCDLYLPPANGQREPGTDIVSIMTAEGLVSVQANLLR